MCKKFFFFFALKTGAVQVIEWEKFSLFAFLKKSLFFKRKKNLFFLCTKRRKQTYQGPRKKLEKKTEKKVQDAALMTSKMFFLLFKYLLLANDF